MFMKWSRREREEIRLQTVCTEMLEMTAPVHLFVSRISFLAFSSTTTMHFAALFRFLLIDFA